MMKRRAAACLALASVLSIGACAERGPKPNLAPRPDRIESRSGEGKDWFSAALNIQHPMQFRAWEPVLEEMSGEKPVPWQKVFLADPLYVHEFCDHENSVGCHTPGRGLIHISTEHSQGGLGYGMPYQGGQGRCVAKRGPGLRSYPRLGAYVHEQGHSFDRQLGKDDESKWIDQLEAVLFELYFAEHSARALDRRLGLDLYIKLLSSAKVGIIHMADRTLGDGTDHDLPLRIGMLRDGRMDPWCGGLALQSALALLGSGSPDFSDAWYFVHTSPQQEVVSRLESSAGAVERGRRQAERNMVALAGGKTKVRDLLSELEAFVPGGLLGDSCEEDGTRAVFDRVHLDLASGEDNLFIMKSRGPGPRVRFSMRREEGRVGLRYLSCDGPLCSSLELDDRGRSVFSIDAQWQEPPFCFQERREAGGAARRFMRAAMLAVYKALSAISTEGACAIAAGEARMAIDDAASRFRLPR